MQQVVSGAAGNYRQMEDTGCCMNLVQRAEHHHKYVFICTLLWSVMDVACVSCCLTFLLNYLKKKSTHRSSWVVAPFFPVASDSSYISFKTYAHFSCIPQCKYVRDAGIYWRKRTLQSCTAEGGTGGPEKTHLWVKGSHSAFHSRKAVDFASAARGSTELTICFLWRGSDCAQRQCMTCRRAWGRVVCPAWRAKGCGQFHRPCLAPLPRLAHYPGPAVIVPPPSHLSVRSTWTCF